MTILTYLDFKAELALPDTFDISEFIDRYEDEALIKILGATLGIETKSQYLSTGHDAKWTELVDGVVSTNGVFRGLRIALANYVYYNTIHTISTYVTDNGVVHGLNDLTETKNAGVRISPANTAYMEEGDAARDFIDLKNGESTGTDVYENADFSYDLTTDSINRLGI